MNENSVRNSRTDFPVSADGSCATAAAVSGFPLRTLGLALLVRQHQLLGKHAGVAGFQGADLEAFRPCGGDLVALDGVTFVVVDDDRAARSEERRVGKECRSRWSPYH